MFRSRSGAWIPTALMFFSIGGVALNGRAESGELAFLSSSLWTKAHDVEIRG